MRTSASRQRRFAGILVLALTVLAPGAVVAQNTAAVALFDDARALDLTLRKEIGAYRAGAPPMPLVRRARILVGTYEDIARLFPGSAYGDRSLWQGASLAADVFGVFKEDSDRASAVRLTEELEARYPSSPLLAQARRRVAVLAAPTSATTLSAKPAVARPPATTPAASPTAAQATVQALSNSLLRAIHRQVLPGVLRVTLEFDREVAFNEERLEGPSRVFFDLLNTRAVTDIQDARLAFDDDVVRQIRVGRPVDNRIRVVLDLSNAPVHSVYTRYTPFRIVIDFERPRAGVTPAPQIARVAAVPALKATDTTAPIVIASAATTTPIQPTVPAPRRETVVSAPLPARIPGGLSMSRQLGLGVARVVIDPGHGGHDPGATEGSLTEAELVLDVALRLEQLLLKEGIEVVLTRRNNAHVPLEERPAMAMREGADLYLSIHANASADRRVRGVETYILNFAPNGQSAAVAARENRGSARTMKSLPDIVKAITLNNKIDESRDLARQVQATLVEKLSKGNRTVRNLGVKQAPFAVLVGAEMPSILAEIGFITNKQDAALVKTAAYRQQIAEALAGGIVRYQKRLKPAQVATAK